MVVATFSVAASAPLKLVFGTEEYILWDEDAFKQTSGHLDNQNIDMLSLWLVCFEHVHCEKLFLADIQVTAVNKNIEATVQESVIRFTCSKGEIRVSACQFLETQQYFSKTKRASTHKSIPPPRQILKPLTPGGRMGFAERVGEG
jgi:hypothetical protein